VNDFMLATGHLAEDAAKAAVRLHLRSAKGRWQGVHCLVVPMCRHAPPRLGLAFTPLADPGTARAPDEYHQVTIHADEALQCLDRFGSHLTAGAFSTRQWEILTRLVRGDRAQDIADALFLSASTVRNHLTAIYRKFGVHSQSELLATLLRAAEGRQGDLPRSKG
jgi:DNA-binding CsgD family transcriptional regulator